MVKQHPIYPILLLYAFIAVFTIVFFNGTGDAGDSIHHYLFAKYAPQHPELFFNHWAKPVYVLLASPFAQFGFVGVKIFNALVSLFTLLFTYKIAQHFNLKNAYLAPVFLLFMPLVYELTFSGLTEPLFALFLSAGTFFALKKNFLHASILISFLPFVRSEGLIILAVFGLYFLLKKQWKYIPLLFLGHVLYSIVGYFVYDDILWVFNKIPYAKLSSIYGHGDILHFVDQFIYVTGLPIYFLFWVGTFSGIFLAWKRQISSEIMLLIYLGFFSFFIAHSLFWYFGIFNSMGLKRVLISVAPFAAILALIGFNTLTEQFLKQKQKAKIILKWVLVLYVIIFPFTSNPAAVQWHKNLTLDIDQRTAQQVAHRLIDNNYGSHRFIHAHPYLSEVLEIDHFDTNKKLELTRQSIDEAQPGDILIWENWFAVVEHGINKSDLDSDSRYQMLFEMNANEFSRDVTYAVYQRN